MPHPAVASPPVPTILPSILSADFARLADDVRDVASHLPVPQAIHLDVMDGHCVPNISFGPPVIRRLRQALPDWFFDVHLMIDEPMRYADAHVKAGADCLTFHVEQASDPEQVVRGIRSLGVRVGITLKPRTPVEAIWSLLKEVDLVLVMSVEPGFGGQRFMPDQLDKCRAIKPRLRADQILEIDGGINLETIRAARHAGVDWFVVGSALFDADDRETTAASMMQMLR